MRTLIVAVAVFAASLASLAGVGTASADKPLPRYTWIGENMGTFGHKDYCRGSVRLGLDAPTGKRGVVRLSVTSFGFTGNGPGWKRDPRCKVLFQAGFTSGSAFAKKVQFTGTFGPKRGTKIVRDIRTGSGLVYFEMATLNLKGAVKAPQSYGTSFYLVVP